MKKARRPALAPLYALGISFVLVLVLGTILLRKASPQAATPPASGPPAPLIKVTVEGTPTAIPPSGIQNFSIQIMANNPSPEKTPYNEWSLPIPSISLAQEKLMDQLVCLSGPTGWKVKQSSIQVDEKLDSRGRRCTTKPVQDPQPGEISFTVSTN